MKHQRGLLIARKDLVTKLKGSVQKPAVTRLFFYSNFPSINGLIGTWSLLILSLLNMSADCKDSSISILLFVIISTLALAVHLSLIFYGEKVVVVLSLDTCSNVFALLTPILENSFTLSLAV